MNSAHLVAGRALMGDSLGFHLLFITFGVGLPLLISLLELYGLISKRPRARVVAHTWSKALVVLFVAGAVSGTIISLQFSLLWPVFMALAGKIVGAAFVLEGIAFLVEALFLSIYMLSWNRLSPLAHWLCSVPIVLGSIGSAFFITTVNAFMNTPQGFSLDAHGNPINIHPWTAMFSPAAFHEITHSIAAYIFTTLLVLIALYAWLYWRRPERDWIPKLLVALSIGAVLMGTIVALLGDVSGKQLAQYEPRKLAAAEGLQHTQSHAPLTIGGIVQSDNTIKYGLVVPGLLSWLATGDVNGTVTGLDAFTPQDRPPLVIHYFFDAMVAIGTIGIGAPLLFLILYRFRRAWSLHRLALLAMMVVGVLGMIGVECGWLLAELGRQPYVITDVLLVRDALTRSSLVLQFAYLFPVFFAALLVLTFIALRRNVHVEELPA